MGYKTVTGYFLFRDYNCIMVIWMDHKGHKKGKHDHEGKHKDPKEDLFDQLLVKGPQNLRE